MLDINPVRTAGNNTTDQGQQTSADKEPENKAQMLGQLASGHNTEFIGKEDNSKLVFIFTLIICLIVLGLAGYLYFIKTTKAQELSTKERMQADLNAKINANDLKEVNQMASQFSIGLDQLSKLITAPVEYSKLYNYLGQITPSSVTYDSIDIDDKGKIKLSVKSNSLEDIAKFIKEIESSDYFSNITMDSTQQAKNTDKSTYYKTTLAGTLNTDKLKNKEAK